MKNRSWLPEAALLGVAFIWGGGFVASKVALEGWNTVEILFLRFGCAAFFQAVLLGKSIRRSSAKMIGYGVATGLLFMGALCFQLSGLKYTSSAKSGFICGSYAALVPFISWGIQRTRPRYRDVAAGMLAVTGIGILSLDEKLTLGKGEFLSIFFTILYGMMIVLVAQYSSVEHDRLQMTFFQFLTIAVASGILVIMQGGSLRCSSLRPILAILYLIGPNTVIAMSIQNIAQGYVEASRASLLMSMEAIFAFVFSTLFFREKVDMRILLGCALCMCAIFMSALKKKTT